MFKCVSCKKGVDNLEFGVFVILQPVISANIGLRDPVLIQNDEGLIQFKVCKECRNKNFITIDVYEERNNKLKPNDKK